MPARRFLFPALLLLAGAFLLLPADAQSKKKRSPAERAEAYIARLKRGKLTANKRDRYFAALKKLGKRAGPALAKGWQALEEDDASRALELLGELRTTRAQKGVIKASTDPRVKVRTTAAELLGGFPATRKTTGALAQLMADPEGEVALVALQALGKLRSKECWPVLLSGIQDHAARRGWPREAAARALGRVLAANFSAARVEEVLGDCAAAEDEDVRNALFMSLTESDRKKIAPYLVRALETYVPKGRGGPVSLPASSTVQASSNDAFKGGGEGAGLLPLPESLGAMAVTSIGQLRNPKLFPLLMRCLVAKGSDVRLATLGVISLSVPNAAARDELIGAVIKRLADRKRAVRLQAHAWLKRETGQKISMSFSLWQDWLKKSKEGQLEEAVAAIAEENGFGSVAEFLESGGYQFLGDYLADGGREKVQEYLDRQQKKKRPVVPQGDIDPNNM